MPIIDFDKALKEQLIRSLELENYRWITNNVQTIDVTDTNNSDFQKKYDSFWDVRRNETWRKEYFEYLQEIKMNSNVTFEHIIKDLNERLPKSPVEPSFSSKMLATINTKMPIWDSRVLRKLKFDKDWDKNKTVDNAVIIYKKICVWYESYMKSDEFLEIIERFDEYFPEYKDISDAKKIDYLLWSLK